MPVPHFVSFFFAGVFFANFVPHFVSGVLGRTFPTPFASPPFRGPSSPRVNVLYSLVSLVAVHALLFRVGDFDPRNALHALAFTLGLGAWAWMIARSLARLEKAGLRS